MAGSFIRRLKTPARSSAPTNFSTQIQLLTLRSYRSNFADGYPTDCPHREKNGWTGDAHLAAEQAMYNFGNAAAYLKWLNDFKDEQQPDGNLPGIVPTSGWGYQWGNGPAWDSAYVLIPWYLYQYCGDTRVLADHYDGMKRYVDFMTSEGHRSPCQPRPGRLGPGQDGYAGRLSRRPGIIMSMR